MDVLTLEFICKKNEWGNINMENGNVVVRNEQVDEFDQYQKYQDLLKVIEDNHRKDTRRMYIFFIGLFLLFVAVIWLSLIFIDSSFIIELRAGNNSIMKNTDYLELVIPILIAIAAAFIAFLGINRLKDMDAQVDQMRSGINAELEKEIKRVASLRSDLSEHIDVAISRKTVDFSENMEKRLKSASNDGVQRVIESQKEALSEITKSKGEFLELYEQIREGWNNFDERYKWLLSNEQATKDVFLKEVATVYDVHQAIEAMWNSPNRPDNVADLTKRYVEKVIEDNSILRGDEDDYHNLAAECARHYLYDLSCKVCETGLKIFTQNIDLLADWIQYGTKLGDINVVTSNPLNKLLSIDKILWNWRAFDFTIDFYLAARLWEKAEALANDFVLYHPYEERAYYCQAEVFQQCYAKEEGMKKTLEALQTAMDKNINCPLCANRLAELLSDCGRLEDALVAANRAIQELSQEQPSVNYGFVIYRRALIQDRLSYKKDISSSQAHDLAEKAIIDYQVAINSGRLTAITLVQAQTRYKMLKTYFHISDSKSQNVNFGNDASLSELMETLNGIVSQSDS